MKIFLNFLIFALVAGCAIALFIHQSAPFVPPSGATMTRLLGYEEPASLKLTVIDSDDLDDFWVKGESPLSSYRYDDASHLSETYHLAVFETNTFMKGDRQRLASELESDPGGAFDGIVSLPDGRKILYFVLGLGPGGGIGGSLIPSRDGKHELVLLSVVDFHDDEDPKLYAHFVRPKKAPKDIIDQLERIVFPKVRLKP